MSSSKTKQNHNHKKQYTPRNASIAATSHSKFPVILCAALLFIGSLCFFSGRFYVSTFGRLGFDSVLYTLSSGLGGV